MKCITSLAIEVGIVFHRLATNVAHYSTASAPHFVASIFLYKFFPTFPAGSVTDKIENPENQGTLNPHIYLFQETTKFTKVKTFLKDDLILIIVHRKFKLWFILY